jgi:hypothetical protein
LWHEDDKGRPLWPHGEPATLCAQPMKNVDEIVKSISGFIKYWESFSNEDSKGEYHRHYEDLCYYKCGVKDALVLPIQLILAFRMSLAINSFCINCRGAIC